MRSPTIVLLLVFFFGLTSGTTYFQTMDKMKMKLQSQINWILQSEIDHDEELYHELVVPRSAADEYLAGQKHHVESVVVMDAFVSDDGNIVHGTGYVTEATQQYYVRMGMVKDEASRTDFVMFDWVLCGTANCEL